MSSEREIRRVTTNATGDVVACNDVEAGDPVYWDDDNSRAGAAVQPRDGFVNATQPKFLIIQPAVVDAVGIENIRKLFQEAPMNTDELTSAVAKLNAIGENDDSEKSHIEADEIILAFLDSACPQLSDAYRAARDRVGFYYS